MLTLSDSHAAGSESPCIPTYSGQRLSVQVQNQRQPQSELAALSLAFDGLLGRGLAGVELPEAVRDLTLGALALVLD
jgi:hypothetical protein